MCVCVCVCLRVRERDREIMSVLRVIYVIFFVMSYSVTVFVYFCIVYLLGQ